MKKKGQKNIIKFQRKQIQISNTINDNNNQIRQNENCKKGQTKHKREQLPPVTLCDHINDQLQIPKNMKVNNTINNIRKKLMGILEYQQPPLPVDSLFQSQQICMITGNKPKTNRQSFGKSSRMQEAIDQPQHIKIPQTQSNLFYYPPKDQSDANNQYFKKLPKDRILPNYAKPQKNVQEQPNYLEIYSQASHNQIVSLQEVFKPTVPTNIQIPQYLPNISQTQSLPYNDSENQVYEPHKKREQFFRNPNFY